MANVTPTTAAPFIPQVWAGQALGRIAGNLILASLVNRNWENEFKGVGATINIPRRGAVSVAQKAPGVAVTPQAPNDSTVQVVLDSHYVGAVLVEDITSAEVNQDVGDGYVTDIAVALSEQIETSGLTKAYTGFTANAAVGAAGTDASEALIRTVRKALVDAKVPQNMPRYAIWSTKDATALLGIQRLTEAQSLGFQDSSIREADLGKLFGVRHVESQYVVTTGAAPVDTHCIAFAPDALTLAMRPLKKPKGPGAMSYTMGGPAGTAASGLGLRVTISYEGKDMGDLLTVDALWGWAVVRDEFGVHVHT